MHTELRRPGVPCKIERLTFIGTPAPERNENVPLGVGCFVLLLQFKEGQALSSVIQTRPVIIHTAELVGLIVCYEKAKDNSAICFKY